MSFTSFGQDNFPLVRQRLNHLFEKLNQTELRSLGILEEQSFGFMNLGQVNTTSTMPKDSLHYINSLVWRMTYATLESGKINNSYNLPPIDTVNQRLKQYLGSNPKDNLIS